MRWKGHNRSEKWIPKGSKLTKLFYVPWTLLGPKYYEQTIFPRSHKIPNEKSEFFTPPILSTSIIILDILNTYLYFFSVIICETKIHAVIILFFRKNSSLQGCVLQEVELILMNLIINSFPAQNWKNSRKHYSRRFRRFTA